MPGINTVTLVGTLAEVPDESPEHRVILCLAVTEPAKRDGEWTEAEHRFDVAVYGKQGTACIEHLREGSMVAVAGRLVEDEILGVMVVAATVQSLDREAVSI